MLVSEGQVCSWSRRSIDDITPLAHTHKIQPSPFFLCLVAVGVVTHGGLDQRRSPPLLVKISRE